MCQPRWPRFVCHLGSRAELGQPARPASRRLRNHLRGSPTPTTEPLTPSCIPGGTNHKVSLAVKMIVYTTIGWGLPFFAWKYTEYKVNSN